jgi:predicted SprT family Zn-dependent metalloprotease
MKNKNYIQRYYKIVDHLIKNNFPILKDKKIKIYENKRIRFSADTRRFPFFLRIRTNPILREHSDGMLIGIFAHELTHLEKFVNSSKFEYYILREFKIISKKFIKREEEETDKEVIKKGYAKELYLQRKSRWGLKDRKIEKLKKFYISPDKIKNYAISIGKWENKKCLNN